jgi:alpha-L-rhamnosidase
VIRLQVLPNLMWVRCSYHSVRGKIISNWKREGARLKLEVEIPANTTARLLGPAVNASQIKVNDRRASASAQAKLVSRDDGKAVFETGSGWDTVESSATSRRPIAY